MLDLDLVPPVLIRTLGDELSPSGTVVSSISRVIRINTQCVQIFLQCVLPCPLWSSGPPSATFWSPHYGPLQNFMVTVNVFNARWHFCHVVISYFLIQDLTLADYFFYCIYFRPPATVVLVQSRFAETRFAESHFTETSFAKSWKST